MRPEEGLLTVVVCLGLVCDVVSQSQRCMKLTWINKYWWRKYFVIQLYCFVCFSPSPTTLAGIASSILLFVAIIATMVCCFMCSCCYLYQRRQQRGRTPYDGKNRLFSSCPPRHIRTSSVFMSTVHEYVRHHSEPISVGLSLDDLWHFTPKHRNTRRVETFTALYVLYLLWFFNCFTSAGCERDDKEAVWSWSVLSAR